MEWVEKGKFTLRRGSAQEMARHTNTDNVDIHSPTYFNGYRTQRYRNA
jgi:hypothetical protein